MRLRVISYYESAFETKHLKLTSYLLRVGTTVYFAIRLVLNKIALE